MAGLVAALLLALSVEVEGPGACPSASDVARAIAPLLPGDFESTNSDVARIEEAQGGSLTISLARPDGSEIGRRLLPPAPTCAEQAETVAVTFAAWQARIHPEITLRLDRLAAAPSSGPLLARASASPSVKNDARFTVGAGLGGGWQPDSIAPGGRLDLTLGGAETSWRGRASVVGLGKHVTSVLPGQATWWRVFATAGVDYVQGLGQGWSVVVGAGGLVGEASIAGTGFMLNHATTTVDVGSEALLRVQRRLGRVTPWLGVAAAVWFRRQSLEVTGVQTSKALPRVEPVVAMGADCCWGSCNP